MKINNILNFFVAGFMVFTASCGIPSLVQKKENNAIPVSYNSSQDSTNSGKIVWKDFFSDPYLRALIDSALNNNQELNILTQEINISKNEVKARKGLYLPFVNAGTAAGTEKVGRYTRNGAVEATTPIEPGKANPEPLSDYIGAANFSWEIDIWKKLRNAKKSAYHKYIASEWARKFMVTQLVAEIANTYYELMALDNQLGYLKSTIEIQKNALEIVKMQKEAAKVTELAVRKFEAEVLKNMSHQYEVQQKITETENRINYLVGRFPQHVDRNSESFISLSTDTIHAGIPSQLLQNRPDIKQSEEMLVAAKLDVKVAKANFYPSLNISANLGYQAFNPKFLINPQSLIYSVAGDLMGPLINKNGIQAEYLTANNKQIQAVYKYQQTILNAYIEVVNQLSNINNMQKSYDYKNRQVQALTQSIEISTILFKSARADYMEVLMTQRDALEAKFELIETKQRQMTARVNMYQALGGGW